MIFPRKFVQFSRVVETLRFYEDAVFKRGIKKGFMAFPPGNGK